MSDSVPQIFSPARRRTRWLRASRRQQRPNAAAFVFEAFAEELVDRLGFMRHEAQDALVLGDPSGLAAQALRARVARVETASPILIDEEAVIPGSHDMVVSLGLLDTINDVPGALLHLRRALAPEGLAIAAFVGAGSLANLRRALLAAEPERPAARMHPMIDVRSAAALMQRAGFKRQVVDSFSLRVRYGSLSRLIADLRDQGMTNALSSAPPPLTRTGLARAEASFLAMAEADGKVTETFEILTLTGWG